jgi:hypothetical protein
MLWRRFVVSAARDEVGERQISELLVIVLIGVGEDAR